MHGSLQIELEGMPRPCFYGLMGFTSSLAVSSSTSKRPFTSREMRLRNSDALGTGPVRASVMLLHVLKYQKQHQTSATKASKDLEHALEMTL